MGRSREGTVGWCSPPLRYPGDLIAVATSVCVFVVVVRLSDLSLQSETEKRNEGCCLLPILGKTMGVKQGPSSFLLRGVKVS